jgi:prevent-host-death family protein
MSAENWPIAEAKAHFSRLVEQAVTEGPQTVTRNGRPTAVVVSVQEWERKTRRTDDLATFFASSPLRGSGLTVERDTDPPREIDL